MSQSFDNCWGPMLYGSWRPDPEAPMHIIDETGTTVAIACIPFRGDAEKDTTEQLANAERIAACVNACQGIPTELLKPGAFEELLAVTRYARVLVGNVAGRVNRALSPFDAGQTSDEPHTLVAYAGRRGGKNFRMQFLSEWPTDLPCDCRCHSDLRVNRRVGEWGFCQRCAERHEHEGARCKAEAEEPVGALMKIDRGLDLTERAPHIYDERCEQCGCGVTGDETFGCTPNKCANTRLDVIA